jgi:hypothetical protein
MNVNDYIIGISPARLTPRRILFVAQIEEKLTFREAYERFPELRGPEGPIHVKPVNREYSVRSFPPPFPDKEYEFIKNSKHCDDWRKDLERRDLDAFFLCRLEKSWRGRWLGKFGPEIDEEILNFLTKCPVYGNKGRLSDSNNHATVTNPIVHKGQRGYLYKGLHLETGFPERLIQLCNKRMLSSLPDFRELEKMLPKREQLG